MPAVTENRSDAIRNAIPAEGLFAEKDWLISPDPFAISEKFGRELEQLGHRLSIFQRACPDLGEFPLEARNNSRQSPADVFEVKVNRSQFNPD